MGDTPADARKKRGGQPKNKNAAVRRTADAVVMIRMTTHAKNEYTRVARAVRTLRHPRGSSLSAWIIDACDAQLAGCKAVPGR